MNITSRSQGSCSLRHLFGRKNPIGIWLVVQTLSACALVADKSMSDRDIEECRMFTDAVLKAHDLPPAVTTWGSGGRALYCGIYQRNPIIPHLYTRVTVYGVVARNEQDRVLTTLKLTKGRDYKPIIVRFFEREIWNVQIRAGGRSEGRGEEVILRTEILR
jgi:hypothetical protein